MTKLPRIAMMKPRLATIDTRTVKPAPKQVDAHYTSPEHKAWALEVKRRAGWRCEHVEAGVRCEKRHPTSIMYADHIIEIKDGGAKLDLKNGACKCNSHNTRKGIEARAARLAEKS